MVTMSAIWDRTAEVLRGRGSMLAGIAALLLFLPAVVQDAVSAHVGTTPAALGLAGLVGIVVVLMAIWGNLALVAAAGEPPIDRQAAFAVAARRLGPAIGLTVLVGLVVMLAAVPGLAMLGIGLGPSASRLTTLTVDGAATLAAGASPGLILAGSLYLFLFALAVFWLGARLALSLPVLVNERRGLRSVARSFELTRRLTWRIIGVILLALILLLVALSAAQFVFTVIARLLLGAGGVSTAQFVGAVAGAAVTAGATVVSSTFVAQLYRVVSGREAAYAFA
ncbi:glycerophosphoryl diester phosphodiesterase membrane domain-containing protein [uncultured Sphingomonas sp.]|uniref:glycerophosphoryl diester phosphodiesterase membrane domain-containing protein n=1 Tax=uncultured Sphingomonas sp. TaxID=158754 RepID=UPI0035C9D691